MPLNKEEKGHYEDLLHVNYHRLWQLERQQAHYGTDCPPHISLEISNISEKILQIKDILSSSQVNSTEIYTYTKEKIDKDKSLIFDNQEIIYHYLCDYVRENGAHNATLIQYSGRRATPLLWMLLQGGAKVVMYVQHPKFAISQRQKHRIKSTIKELPDEIKPKNEARLRIYYYDTPSSFRGVNIDDKILSIGNYIYEYCDDKLFPNDKVAISGHDVPGMLLYNGSQWYDIYNRMFNDVVINYKRYTKLLKRKPKLDTARKRVVR